MILSSIKVNTMPRIIKSDVNKAFFQRVQTARRVKSKRKQTAETNNVPSESSFLKKMPEIESNTQLNKLLDVQTALKPYMVAAEITPFIGSLKDTNQYEEFYRFLSSFLAELKGQRGLTKATITRAWARYVDLIVRKSADTGIAASKIDPDKLFKTVLSRTEIAGWGALVDNVKADYLRQAFLSHLSWLSPYIP
jgi:hypothetical protein